MKFTKKDLVYSIITGLTTGVIVWRILAFLKPETFASPVLGIGFIVVVPILWIIGVNLGYFLGRWMSFFNQFGRFAAIGFTNAAVDFGILNILIGTSGISTGLNYTLFKTISFTVSMLHSYFWNRVWAFQSNTSQHGKEFLKFFTSTVIAALVNIAIASGVVNLIHPVLGLSSNTWANVGAIVGSAVSLILSFILFRLLVFRNSR